MLLAAPPANHLWNALHRHREVHFMTPTHLLNPVKLTAKTKHHTPGNSDWKIQTGETRKTDGQDGELSRGWDVGCGASAGRGARLSTEMTPRKNVTGSPGSLKQRWKLKDGGESGPGVLQGGGGALEEACKASVHTPRAGIGWIYSPAPLFLVRCTGSFSADTRLQFLLHSSVGYWQRPSLPLSPWEEACICCCWRSRKAGAHCIFSDCVERKR